MVYAKHITPAGVAFGHKRFSFYHPKKSSFRGSETDSVDLSSPWFNLSPPSKTKQAKTFFPKLLWVRCLLCKKKLLEGIHFQQISIRLCSSLLW